VLYVCSRPQSMSNYKLQLPLPVTRTPCFRSLRKAVGSNGRVTNIWVGAHKTRFLFGSGSVPSDPRPGNSLDRTNRRTPSQCKSFACS
jgi:hypothetical protein